MIDIYLVDWWDGYADSEYSLLCCFLDKEVALKFASEYLLDHDQLIRVEHRYIGFIYKVEEIYMRKHYDYTKVLFDSICWYDGYGFLLENTCSREELMEETKRQYSLIKTEFDWDFVDWDRMLNMYKEYSEDDDDDDYVL